jgi:WD40 repeat protein
VNFAPDGKLMASCSDDRTVRVWDSSTFQELALLQGHRQRVWFITFSPTGTQLLSASHDNTIRVWDASGFAQLAILEADPQAPYVSSVAFSIDGKAILTSYSDGLAWVSTDEHNCEHCFTPGLFHTDTAFLAVWTAVSLSTAMKAHPRHAQAHLYANGWLISTRKFSFSQIWLPAERRGMPKAVASSGSRLVVGGNSGAMTMLALCH